MSILRASIPSVALVVMAAATPTAQTKPPRIPTCTGLTLVTAVNDATGDYESIKTIEGAGEKAYRQPRGRQLQHEALAARAAAVENALAQKFGIDPARLTPEGFGESRPRGPNDTLYGRARNRRVELVRAP
jgi:hypothetical protein